LQLLNFIPGRLSGEEVCNEYIKELRFQQDGEDESYNGTPEMCFMVDVVFVATAHVAGVDQVEDTKDDARNGQHHVEIDLLHWCKEDVGEDHRRNCTRCAYGTVTFIIPVPGDGADGREECGRHVKQDVKKRTGKDQAIGLQVLLKNLFNPGTKRVKDQHIDAQVHVIGMEKGMGEDPVVLSLMDNVVGRQVEPVEEFPVPECCNRA